MEKRHVTGFESGTSRIGARSASVDWFADFPNSPSERSCLELSSLPADGGVLRRLPIAHRAATSAQNAQGHAGVATCVREKRRLVSQDLPIDSPWQRTLIFLLGANTNTALPFPFAFEEIEANDNRRVCLVLSEKTEIVLGSISGTARPSYTCLSRRMRSNAGAANCAFGSRDLSDTSITVRYTTSSRPSQKPCIALLACISRRMTAAGEPKIGERGSN